MTEFGLTADVLGRKIAIVDGVTSCLVLIEDESSTATDWITGVNVVSGFSALSVADAKGATSVFATTTGSVVSNTAKAYVDVKVKLGNKDSGLIRGGTVCQMNSLEDVKQYLLFAETDKALSVAVVADTLTEKQVNSVKTFKATQGKLLFVVDRFLTEMHQQGFSANRDRYEDRTERDWRSNDDSGFTGEFDRRPKRRGRHVRGEFGLMTMLFLVAFLIGPTVADDDKEYVFHGTGSPQMILTSGDENNSTWGALTGYVYIYPEKNETQFENLPLSDYLRRYCHFGGLLENISA